MTEVKSCQFLCVTDELLAVLRLTDNPIKAIEITKDSTVKDFKMLFLAVLECENINEGFIKKTYGRFIRA